MKAKEVMTNNVATIRASATIADAVRLMRFKELRSLIVEPRMPGDAYGIITETDITGKVVACGTDPKKVRVYQVMSKPCIVVNPDLEIEYVARLFSKTGIWRAPVIQGELLDLISVTDIIMKGEFIETPKVTFLQRELQRSISNARTISATYGNQSKDAQAAWDLVDDIEAEMGFYGAAMPTVALRDLENDEEQGNLNTFTPVH